RALFTLDSVQVVSQDFDHNPRFLPVVLKDLPFDLGTYSRGDLNRDGHVDLLDLFLSCDVIAEPDLHPIQDVIRADANLDGQPDIRDLDRIRDEIISPSLPWPRDPNLPKRSPSGKRVRQVLIKFVNRGEPLDIVELKLLPRNDARLRLRSVEEVGTRKAWLYQKELSDGRLAVFAVSQAGKLNPGSPYYRLILNLETDLSAEEAADLLQVAQVQAVTASGQLVYPQVRISPAEQAQILDERMAPTKRSLRAYPNPFNSSTRISFSLAQSGRVKVRIYDVRGRLVATLADAVYAAGNHSVVWQSTDRNGAPVPSGIYICRLEAGGERLTRKILLVR
ncbi:MAG TPA: T9SS type A sorting domain-containing protein, partial [Bacteroidetes bacterium]|nr:T9SS type A sorting domain-containing protein [Bacteroidota bacterium]